MKVLVVGVGGIGSFLVDDLFTPEVKESQLSDVHVTVVDDDVVERRNVLYQNFDEFHADAMAYKVEALVESGLELDETLIKRIETPEELEGYDVVISCVDNVKFRRMMFQHQNKIPFWIDLRAEGRRAQCITKDAGFSTAQLLSLTKESEDESKNERGCALEGDLAAGRLQFGNRLAALMGAQALLNHYRGIRKPIKASLDL
jgi:molybdopterin/thiamine biosynthesis adenylyltransferase